MFTRRTLLATAAALPLAGTAQLLMADGHASMDRPYVSVDEVKDLQAAGKTILVDWKAEWCGTCKVQDRVIKEILADDPSLMEAITFVNLDWDLYGDDPYTQELNIPRRSTLVLFKGEEEIGRIVAGTARGDIEALIRQGL